MSTLSFVTHFRGLSISAKALGLQAQLQLDGLRVEVAGADRYFELEPEFAVFDPRGAREFSHQPLPRSRVFTGWRCAPKKSSPVSTDKGAFMAFCARHGVRTPRTYAHPSEVTTPVLIKQARPGLRGVLRGPFAPGAIPAEFLQLPPDLILQEFVLGLMLEAWYWDGHLFAVEIHNRPSVTGDGITPLRDLISGASLRTDWIEWMTVEDTVRFQGETLETVPPAGKELAVDIRFASAVQRPEPENVLETLIGTPIHKQLLHAGPAFRNAIPEPIRAHTQFVLCAVIDAQQELWFTDMSTDMRIHPDVYDLMLRSLFGLPAPLPGERARSLTCPPASAWKFEGGHPGAAGAASQP
jgi:hypothetical protein